MFSSRFMLFPTFLENNFFRGGGGGGGEYKNKQNFMVFASEPVGGRSCVTELPCSLWKSLYLPFEINCYQM